MNKLSDPYRLLIPVSLGLATLGGFGLGLDLLLSFAFRLPLPESTGALIQAHGQVQTLGFIAVFIMAVASRLVPRLHGTPLVGGSVISVGGLTLAAGLVVRAVAQPLPFSQARDLAVGLSGVFELVGVALAMSSFVRTLRHATRHPEGEPLVVPLTVAVSLFGALALNLAASVGLALGGNIVPLGLDEAILHLELWGFASTIVLAIGMHTWPHLLVLRPTRQGVIVPAFVLWAIGGLGTPLTWLIADLGPARPLTTLAQLGGALLYVYGLRLFERPARASSIPRVTDPARLWVRVAVLFLLAGALLNAEAAMSGVLGNPSVPFLSASATRHTLAQGFFLPMIVLMSARILPGYSALMIRHPRLQAGLMWSLYLGALLRAGGELLGGYSDGWNVLVAGGGLLSTAAFLVFAFGLWREIGAVSPAANDTPLIQIATRKEDA